MSDRRPGVVLVHGLGGTARSMAPLAGALQRLGVVTTALTLPGHGTTPDDLVDVDWHDWTTAVERAAVDADRGAGVVLVGQSMGGAIALSVAGADTARRHVRGAVVVNTPLADPDAVDGIEWRLGRGHTSFDATLAEGEDGYATMPLQAALAMAVGLLALDLAAVDVPVVVVNGALDDTVDPQSGVTLADDLDARSSAPCRRVVLAHSGHVATFGPDVDELADEVLRLVAAAAGDAPLA